MRCCKAGAGLLRNKGLPIGMAHDAKTTHEPSIGMAIPEQDRFRLLVEAVTDYAIYMLDAGGYVASWNAGAERAKGYTREEILGQHFSRFYSLEDRNAGLPQLALNRAKTEGRFEGEGWRVRKNGTRMWAHVIIDPIRDSEGGLIGYAKITRDLTERRKAEEALRQSEERFRMLVEGVSDYAIYMLDPTGRVTNWNVGAHRIKGYTADEIVGENFARFYTQEDREAGEPERALKTAAREGRFEKEAQRLRKDGTRFWASVVIDAIRDVDGNLLGFAKITRDITERIQAQAELEKTREAFHQSQKMESLGQLSGGIAHDFNNLLMAVLSSLEMLRKRLPDDPKLIQLLDNAVQGAERGASLTQRMLSFARRQSLDPKAVDIPELVSGLKGLLERTIGPKITIETRVEGSVRPARTDANQLELAIINLAVNARDAMPSGGAITVSIRQQIVAEGEDLAPGPYVVVALADTGEGMDDETLARATEPFFTTKGVGRGTGLGLSMVHGFAEQLSGRLKLMSRKGEGATAEIWIPVATEEIERPAMAEAGNDQQTSANGTRPLVVLAVDDDALVQMNTVAMLEDLGHRVVEASNGSEALEAIRMHPDINLVVTDYAMPKMTGRDLAIAIARARPELPVVLATGYADLPPGEAIDVERLPKPFGQNELEKAIARAMKR
jgi:PAS domain S-box-containing protein